ncbi:MAG TPA: ABC transporter substrate-binding protein [Chloroflexota bacterium]|nr:ABC transporter substrate-binding protein [Chloroflexota bacterium]
MAWLCVALAMLLASCAQPPSTPSSAPAQAGGGATADRTLVVAGGRTPESLASKPLRNTGGAGTPRTAMRAMNAGLVLHDERELPHPYLAEALPELDTDSWIVSADGTMTTTYRLHDGLTWHDGSPLTAGDFVFAWRVYATPELGLSASVPLKYLAEVTAPDDRTVVFSWRQPFAGAGDLQAIDLPPLPEHLLAQPFAQRDPEGFVGLPFWVAEYVGAGPYRLSRFEPGAFMEAEAFAGHVSGVARIRRLRLLFMDDANAVVAAVLSGNAHIATADTIDAEQAKVLEQQWADNRGGVVLRSPVGVRIATPQLRPEYATPPALLDPRVRKALAHAIDRQALADTLTQGKGTMADTLVLPQVEYFADVQRAITTYPYDVARSVQILHEAGWVRGSDGVLADASQNRFAVEVEVAAGARNDIEVEIMADSLRQAGVDPSVRVIPRAQITDRQMRSMLPGILNVSHQRAFVPPVDRLRSSEIPTAESRWQGNNQGGWSNPDFDRLVTAYETTLDRAGRNAQVVAMMKLVSEEEPVIPLYYNLSFFAHVSSLQGPMVSVSDDVANWNLPDWSWRD